VTCDASPSRTVAADLTVSITEHRWEGDFSEAIAKLDADSEGPRLDQDSCPIADLAAVEDLWLVDAQGRAVRPSYPVDDCNFQRIGGLREVEALEEVSRTEHRIRLWPDGVQRLMGCGTVRPEPVPGPKVLPAGEYPYSVSSSVCRFRAAAAGVEFAGAEQLMEGLDEAFAALPPTPDCALPATTTVSTSLSLVGPDYSAPIPVLVELDGCRRVLVDGYVPLQASRELLDLVD
jgi:hypothetical protein